MRLVSPATGRDLRPDGPHSLSDGVDRWPLVDGIAYLRVGRDRLVAEVLELLDGGDRLAAMVALLADQDAWWSGPAPPSVNLERLVRERDRLSLRDAMGLLGWGPVAVYFAHRWSDPTFVAGLGLVEAHWNAPGTAFELACGIGHHLRALTQRGVAVTGGDVVFAKLWVARHWMVPDATLLCFDAAARWPIGETRFEMATCHDAFYFLAPKREIAERLRAASGCVLVSHVHNRNWPNLSAGDAVSALELAGLFPGAALYDDAELSRCVVERRAPQASPAVALDGVEALALAGGTPARAISDGLALPPYGTSLCRTPLYDDGGVVRWPSERYAREYGPRATFALRTSCPAVAVSGRDVEDWARRRELVDLPERW